MVGIGVLMIFTGVTAAILFLRKQLFAKRWFQLWCMAMTPTGFVAVLSGWFVTEIGRQPYIVYGVMRTVETVSPVMGSQIAMSLLAFIFSYVFIFGAGSYYIFKLVGKGPDIQTQEYGTHGLKKPPLLTDLTSETGGKHV
jgi:cytochrome d ubiquinol oxidase subunit I